MRSVLTINLPVRYKYEQTEIVAYMEKKGGVKGEVLLHAASQQY